MTEDLCYLIQSNMDDRAFQIQRMLANELDQYKEKGNRYIEENIQEIQKLYIEEKNRGEKGVIEDEEVILVKPYEASTTTLSSIKYKLYNGRSRKPPQAHEVCTNSITDKNIQTTTTLSISQVWR